MMQPSTFIQAMAALASLIKQQREQYDTEMPVNEKNDDAICEIYGKKYPCTTIHFEEL